MKVLLIFFSFIPLLASNLLTYNIYERTDRVDIMLAFDAPYSGKIYQKKIDNKISLTLSDLNFEHKINKNINSSILQTFKIISLKNETVLEFFSDREIDLTASKTLDEFGLRIRIKPIKGIVQQEDPKLNPKLNPKIYEPKKQKVASLGLDGRYFVVLGVLILLLIFLLIVKRFFLNKNSSTKMPMSWLFKNAPENYNVNILYQKPIDNQNKIVLLEYQKRRYLVLIGATSNVLLDQFGQEKIQSQDEFQDFFNQNKKRLGEYLSQRYNPLDSYKEKAGQY